MKAAAEHEGQALLDHYKHGRADAEGKFHQILPAEA
jgi:hypothetical protein